MRIVAPDRSSQHCTLQLIRPPEEVFPLLCPVRECEWLDGWDPGVVVTQSGVAEADCVFITDTSDRESIWVVTGFAPPSRITFLKMTPGETVDSMEVLLQSNGEGGTLARVTYTVTALGPIGKDVVRTFSAAHHRARMKSLETGLNHFLEAGTRLSSTDRPETRPG